MEPFSSATLGRFSWRFLPELRRFLAQTAGWDHHQWRERAARVFKDGQGRLCVGVYSDERRPVFVKINSYRRLRKRFRSLFRPTDTEKEWTGSLAACDRGLPTPRPLAMGEQRVLGMVAETILMFEWNANAVPLSILLDEGTTRSQRWDLARRLGALVNNLHRNGLAHRELKASNLLWLRQEHHLLFVDNKHLTVRSSLSEEKRIANLIRISQMWRPRRDSGKIGRMEEYAFLIGYAGQDRGKIRRLAESIRVTNLV
jgi:hypothetical protein